MCVRCLCYSLALYAQIKQGGDHVIASPFNEVKSETASRESGSKGKRNMSRSPKNEHYRESETGSKHRRELPEVAAKRVSGGSATARMGFADVAVLGVVGHCESDLAERPEQVGRERLDEDLRSSSYSAVGNTLREVKEDPGGAAAASDATKAQEDAGESLIPEGIAL